MDKLQYSGDRMLLAAGAFRNLADAYTDLMVNEGTMMEYKSAIVMQLGEMANLLDKYSGHQAHIDNMTIVARRNVIKALRGRGVLVKEFLIVNREDSNQEIKLIAKTQKGRCITLKELTRVLGECMGNKYVSIDNRRIIVNHEEQEYYFRQAPRFESICRVANRCKDNGNVCGDSFSHVTLNNGREIACIVDGMGSGVRANHDSRVVIELLEQFLEAGFSENAAIQMINTAFSINDCVGNPITLDMCIMDMYLGVANFIKLGAVATFIKRKGWVEVIKSTTLPIGVLAKVDFDSTIKKLYDGDYIIMVSDGIVDSFLGENKEEELMGVIASQNVINPQQLADNIIEEALKRTEGIPRDDMTVVVNMINLGNY